MGPEVRKERDTDICPMCDEVERTNHVFECRSELTTQTFEEKYDTLKTWMRKHSPRDLSDALLETLLAVRERRDPIEQDDWTDQVKDAFRAQCNLSVKAVSSGLLHSDWLPIQAAHARRNRAKMKPESWAGHVVLQIWDITWTIWRARTEFLHSTEEARKKILAATTDNQIDQIFHNLPANTWMTKAQRALLSTPKRIVKGYKARRKIRWVRKATIARKSYESYLNRTQNSASARVMRDFVGYGEAQENNGNSSDDEHIDHHEQDYGNDSDTSGNTNNGHNNTIQRQTRITDWIHDNG